MLGIGKMIGDDEAIRGVKHLTTVICNSSEAKVFQMKKEVSFILSALNNINPLKFILNFWFKIGICKIKASE